MAVSRGEPLPHRDTISQRVWRVLERDDDSSNRHLAPAYCWSMTFSENRYPLFGIMLWDFASIHLRRQKNRYSPKYLSAAWMPSS